MQDSDPVFDNIYQVEFSDSTFNEDGESSCRHLRREAWSTGSTSGGLVMFPFESVD